MERRLPPEGYMSIEAVRIKVVNKMKENIRAGIRFDVLTRTWVITIEEV